MIVGGEKLDYPGNTRSPDVSILDTEIHINSTISDAKNGLQYLGIDRKFYLITLMSYFQYLKVHHTIITECLMNEKKSM